MSRLLPLTLLASCSAIHSPPPPNVTAPVVYAQPSCEGMRPTTLFTSPTQYGVVECCPEGDGVTLDCWQI